MGRIGRAHGVRGLVHLTSYTDPPEAIFAHADLVDHEGRPMRLARAGSGTTLLASIAGVCDRNAAARLTNREIYAERCGLPEPGAEEFYHADLIGLAVEDEAGHALGRVAAVHDHGAGAMLEITPACGAPSTLLPFTRHSVPVVDLDAGRIVVAPPTEIIVPRRAESRP